MRSGISLQKVPSFKTVLMLVFVVVLSQGSYTFAQITKLTDLEAFSNAIPLSFGQLLDDSDASDVYSTLGVLFVGEGPSIPTSKTVIIALTLPPLLAGVIQNRPLTGSSANKSLILRFKYPLLRVGFCLGNG